MLCQLIAIAIGDLLMKRRHDNRHWLRDSPGPMRAVGHFLPACIRQKMCRMRQVNNHRPRVAPTQFDTREAHDLSLAVKSEKARKGYDQTLRLTPSAQRAFGPKHFSRHFSFPPIDGVESTRASLKLCRRDGFEYYGIALRLWHIFDAFDVTPANGIGA